MVILYNLFRRISQFGRSCARQEPFVRLFFSRAWQAWQADGAEGVMRAEGARGGPFFLFRPVHLIDDLVPSYHAEFLFGYQLDVALVGLKQLGPSFNLLVFFFKGDDIVCNSVPFLVEPVYVNKTPVAEGRQMNL